MLKMLKWLESLGHHGRRKIRVVRSGHTIVGTRPKIDCFIWGQHHYNWNTFLLLLDNYSQLEMSLRWRPAPASGKSNNQDNTDSVMKQVIWSGEAHTKYSNAVTIGAFAGQVHTAVTKQNPNLLNFPNKKDLEKIKTTAIHIRDEPIQWGNLNFEGAAVLSVENAANILSGTMLVGELAANVIGVEMD